MTRRHALPPQLADRPFAVHEALDARVARRRLEARDLERPFHGVRVPIGTAESLFERCAALSTRFRDGDAFAGVTAAALWEMPVPLGAAWLHVSSRPPLHPMRRRGVLGTLRTSGAVVVLRGLPLLSPIDAWIDLAGRVELPDAVAAGDWLVTPRRGRSALLDITELRDAVIARAGRHGAPDARRAAALVRAGAWSAPESHLRILLTACDIPEPALNSAVAPDLIPDLTWPDYRVAVEYNGAHHEADAQRRRDLRRAEALEVLGWTTVNVDRVDLYRAPAAVVSRVAQRLRSRGWRGELRWPKTHGWGLKDWAFLATSANGEGQR